MFDQVKFGVSDYVASKAFFLKALAPLGVKEGGEGQPSYGIELCADAAFVIGPDGHNTEAVCHARAA